jgi:hypothetical protein
MRDLPSLPYCFAIFAAACAAPALAQPKTLPPKSHLEVGQYLMINDPLVAADRMSHARLLPDGNLCVFRGDKPQAGQQAPLWCSGSARTKGDYHVVFGADANLCINRGKVPASLGENTSSIWCWGDKDLVGASYVLRVEGAALVAYEVMPSPGSTALRPVRVLWASRKLNKLSGFAGAR